MSRCLRVRRLTLAPTPGKAPRVAAPGSAPSPDSSEVLARESLHRETAVLVVAATPPKKIHGLESRGSRFRALGEDPVDDEEAETEGGTPASATSIRTPTVPKFVRMATAAGFTMEEILRAEREPEDSPGSTNKKTDRLARQIVDAVIKRRGECKPWQGPLPTPRVSPSFTIGDVLDRAQVCSGSLRHQGSTLASPSRSSSPSCGPPASVQVTSVRSDRCGRSLGMTANSKIESRESGSGPEVSDGPATGGSPRRMWPGPGVSYRPSPGLVALYARAGTSRSRQNPRAPHSAAAIASPGCTYAEVARLAMENGDRGGPFGGRGGPVGGRRGGRSNGQGAMFGRGGYLGYNPGYGGGYVYRGGGRFPGRGFGGRHGAGGRGADGVQGAGASNGGGRGGSNGGDRGGHQAGALTPAEAQASAQASLVQALVGALAQAGSTTSPQATAGSALLQGATGAPNSVQAAQAVSLLQQAFAIMQGNGAVDAKGKGPAVEGSDQRKAEGEKC